MADAPAFDPAKPFETVEAPPFDPSKPFEAVQAPSGGQMSSVTALGRGMASGASLGFYDELRGLAEAGGANAEEPMSIGHILKGAYRRVTGSDDADKAYAATVARERGLEKQAQSEHPYLYGAGNVGGALATAPLMPGGALAEGASFLGRMGQAAKTGATYGALSGFGQGEGLEDSLTQGAVGAGIGAAGGAASLPVMAGLEQVGREGRQLIAPAIGALRGAYDPEAEAARRVTGALSRDMLAKRAGMAPADYYAARAAGEPVAIADLGGETTRALARSAANTSPEARSAINDFAGGRFTEQSERIGDTVRNLISGGANAVAKREQLIADARAANKPAYLKAYRDGSGGLWHEGFQQLLQAPDVREAVKAATRTGANRATAEGFPPIRNPFVFGEDGLPSLANPDATPNLQFWDQVKRNLDDRVNALYRSGEKSAASDASTLRNQLVSYLDEAVPSYKNARGTAASFFKASDGLEAGQKFVTAKVDNEEARRALAKMKPAERELFAEGFASELANRVGGMADNRDVTISNLFKSPKARERIEMALGPNRAGDVEMMLRRESIMASLWKAMGNSTTVRQMIESGLAGGATGAYLGDFNPKDMMNGAFVGALLRHGGSKFIGAVDQRTAQRVGEMLVSDDPARLAAGLKTAARSAKVANAIRSLDTKLSGIAGESALRSQVPHVTVRPLLQNFTGTVPADADQPQQRAHGGRVAPQRLGARKAKDGHWYVRDPKRRGKYMKVTYG